MKDTFETGAHRDAQGDKLRFDLIPPEFEAAVARVLTDKAKPPPDGYGERNWEKGIPYMRCVAAIRRHLHDFLLGQDDEDHLAHMACNVMFLRTFEDRIRRGVLPSSLDDRPAAPCGPWAAEYQSQSMKPEADPPATVEVGSWLWAMDQLRQGKAVVREGAAPGVNWKLVAGVVMVRGGANGPFPSRSLFEVSPDSWSLYEPVHDYEWACEQADRGFMVSTPEMTQVYFRKAPTGEWWQRWRLAGRLEEVKSYDLNSPDSSWGREHRERTDWEIVHAI